jgi:hypothetical protein
LGRWTDNTHCFNERSTVRSRRRRRARTMGAMGGLPEREHGVEIVSRAVEIVAGRVKWIDGPVENATRPCDRAVPLLDTSVRPRTARRSRAGRRSRCGWHVCFRESDRNDCDGADRRCGVHRRERARGADAASSVNGGVNHGALDASILASNAVRVAGVSRFHSAASMDRRHRLGRWPRSALSSMARSE